MSDLGLYPDGIYHKDVMENGIRVVTEEIPFGNSVSMGLWVNTGSRDERDEESGITHFIEHMFFKGTERRTALQIAKEIDSVGGVLNAFTGKEYTGIYSKVLDKDLPLALDVLSDIFLNSLVEPDELDKERKVILQEINMVEDTPDDYVHDLFSRAFFGRHPLGRSILGTEETVASFKRERVVGYFKEKYLPSRVIISAAGRLTHQRVLDLAKAAFADFVAEDRGREVQVPQPSPAIMVKPKDLEQVHLCLGTSSPSHCHPRRYSSYVLNAIFGGSMSSRLFQEIREERGLAYAVYSYLNSYMDAGSLNVYVGTSSDALEKTIELIMGEAEKLTEKLIDPDELKAVKEQLKGNLLLGMEHSENWMTRLGKNEIYYGRDFPLRESLERIDQVSSEEVRELAGEIFRPERFTQAVVGAVSDEDLPRALFHSS